MFKIYLYTEELSHFSEITENSPIMIAFILLKKINKHVPYLYKQKKKSMVQWYMPQIPVREAEAKGCKSEVSLGWQDSIRGRKEKEKETKHKLSKRAKLLTWNKNLKYMKFDSYDGLTCSWLMIQLNKHAKQKVLCFTKWQLLFPVMSIFKYYPCHI